DKNGCSNAGLIFRLSGLEDILNGILHRGRNTTRRRARLRPVTGPGCNKHREQDDKQGAIALPMPPPVRITHFCSGGKTLISTRRLSAWLSGALGSAGTSHPFPSMLNLFGSNLYFSISARLIASARARLRSRTACMGTFPFILESVCPSMRITARANWPASRATCSRVASTFGSYSLPATGLSTSSRAGSYGLAEFGKKLMRMVCVKIGASAGVFRKLDGVKDARLSSV